MIDFNEPKFRMYMNIFSLYHIWYLHLKKMKMATAQMIFL